MLIQSFSYHESYTSSKDASRFLGVFWWAAARVWVAVRISASDRFHSLVHCSTAGLMVQAWQLGADAHRQARCIVHQTNEAPAALVASCTPDTMGLASEWRSALHF